MALWQIPTKLSAKLFRDEPSPFADSHPDVRPEGDEDGDNSNAKRKVAKPEAPSG